MIDNYLIPETWFSRSSRPSIRAVGRRGEASFPAPSEGRRERRGGRVNVRDGCSWKMPVTSRDGFAGVVSRGWSRSSRRCVPRSSVAIDHPFLPSSSGFGVAPEINRPSRDGRFIVHLGRERWAGCVSPSRDRRSGEASARFLAGWRRCVTPPILAGFAFSRGLLSTASACRAGDLVGFSGICDCHTVVSV